MAAERRIVRDLSILNKNAEELNARGIYFKPKENNLYVVDVLIVPREKKDGDLVSPYTSGFFMFEITMSAEYPMTPPEVVFHPKQTSFRMHPNYYENGKVCLSVINTWGGNDWTPSISLLALINILEERFNEQALSFEPGFEKPSALNARYCDYVEYGKYHLMLDVQKSIMYKLFQEIIHLEWQKNKMGLLERLDCIYKTHGDARELPAVCYFCKSGVLDYKSLKEKFTAFCTSFP